MTSCLATLYCCQGPLTQELPSFSVVVAVVVRIHYCRPSLVRYSRFGMTSLRLSLTHTHTHAVLSSRVVFAAQSNMARVTQKGFSEVAWTARGIHRTSGQALLDSSVLHQVTALTASTATSITTLTRPVVRRDFTLNEKRPPFGPLYNYYSNKNELNRCNIYWQIDIIITAFH